MTVEIEKQEPEIVVVKEGTIDSVKWGHKGFGIFFEVVKNGTALKTEVIFRVATRNSDECGTYVSLDEAEEFLNAALQIVKEKRDGNNR